MFVQCRPAVARTLHGPRTHTAYYVSATLTHPSRRRALTRAMVYWRLGMRTPPLWMQIPIIASIGPSDLLQLLRLSLALWLL